MLEVLVSGVHLCPLGSVRPPSPVPPFPPMGEGGNIWASSHGPYPEQDEGRSSWDSIRAPPLPQHGRIIPPALLVSSSIKRLLGAVLMSTGPGRKATAFSQPGWILGPLKCHKWWGPNPQLATSCPLVGNLTHLPCHAIWLVTVLANQSRLACDLYRDCLRDIIWPPQWTAPPPPNLDQWKKVFNSWANPYPCQKFPAMWVCSGWLRQSFRPRSHDNWVPEFLICYLGRSPSLW